MTTDRPLPLLWSLLPVALILSAVEPTTRLARADDRLVKVKATDQPITDEECWAVAESITTAVASGNSAAFERQIHWETLAARATAGIDLPDGFQKSFVEGMNQGTAAGQGFVGAIVEEAQRGGRYKCLRVHSDDQGQKLLFRWLQRDGGVNYHDFLLARQPDGRVRVVDFYILFSGEFFSDTLRRLILMGVVQTIQSPALRDRLVAGNQQSFDFFKEYKKLTDARQAGNNREVLELVKALPSKLRRNKLILLTRIKAAQKVGASEYQKAIEEFRAAYPSEACVDLISIDYYAGLNNYREALACIERVDQAVGGDPSLATLRANAYIQMNDLESARATLSKSLRSEPTLTNIYWVLIELDLKEKHHSDVLKNLQILHNRLGVKIADLTQIPVYADFVKSPEYQEWLKETKPKPAEETKPAEGPKG